MKPGYDRAEDSLTIETLGKGVIEHAEQTGSFIAIRGQDQALLYCTRALFAVLEPSVYAVSR